MGCSSSRDPVFEQGDEALARHLESLCARCEQRTSVEGQQLCSVCYRALRTSAYLQAAGAASERRSHSQQFCSLCNANPPNAGYEWCQSCYEVSVQSLTPPHQGQDGDGGRSKLLALLPSRPFLGAEDALTKSGAQPGECTICQIEYEEGDDICLLPMCVHTFHSTVRNTRPSNHAPPCTAVASQTLTTGCTLPLSPRERSASWNGFRRSPRALSACATCWRTFQRCVPSPGTLRVSPIRRLASRQLAQGTVASQQQIDSVMRARRAAAARRTMWLPLNRAGGLARRSRPRHRRPQAI